MQKIERDSLKSPRQKSQICDFVLVFLRENLRFLAKNGKKSFFFLTFVTVCFDF
jgi:hypothetical protein